jgi:hypothetical protein
MTRIKTQEEIENQRGKVKSLLEYFLTRFEGYQHHKENISHAGIILQVTLFAAVFAIQKIEEFFMGSDLVWLLILVITIIWFLLHMFVRVQSRLKRWAALNYAGTIRAYTKYINEDLSVSEFKPVKFPLFEKNRILVFLDYFIPLGRAYVTMDVDDLEIPKLLADSIQKQLDGVGTLSTAYEWFLTMGSYFMYAILIVKIFLS